MATSSGNIIDLDIYGRDNADGSAIQYIDSKAISNALQIYLSSKRGDFLYTPDSGGILDSNVFKVMTLDSLTMLQFEIRNDLTNFFTPNISVISIDLEALYDERALKISVTYSTDTNVETVTVYTASEFNTKRYEYTDVDYIGQNLLRFCQIKKSDMQGQYMELEPNTDVWVWGNYRFINLTEEDEYFEDILLICNS